MQDFILPDIGEGIVECEVVKWLVTQGQSILEDQAVVEVMTDKALVEIPSKYSGVVTKLYYAEGNIAKVHSPLFAMQVIDDVAQQQVTSATTENQPNVVSLSEGGASSKQTIIDTDIKDTDIKNTETKDMGKALASPAVRRLARELDIDLTQITGSGDKGRVLKDDLTVVSTPPVHPNATTAVTTGSKRVEPIRGIQAAMAKHMLHSVFTVPHFSVSEEIQLDKLTLDLS